MLSSGNVGTIVLGYDEELLVPRVIKFYHEAGSVSRGLLEYRILRRFANAPHIMRAYNCFFI